MGFDQGRIILDSANGAYYPGQTVHGRLEFDLEKVKTFRGIYVDVKGWCKVHWSTKHTRRLNDNRTETYTVNHDSYEDYLQRRIYLVGGKSGEHHLGAGHHSLAFECPLPATCPSSFEASHGHIRYEVKAVVDRAFKFDQEKLAALRVIAPLDLNAQPSLAVPVEMELVNSYCCWCMGAGASQTCVKLPAAGYCPGQVMPVEVACSNKSNVGIDKIKFTILRHITFRAERVPDSRVTEDVIAEVGTGAVPANTTRNWTIEVEIPALDVYNFNNCRYIECTYTFKVLVAAESCHEDGEDQCQLVIGDVPLRGFQDDVLNPMRDQIPQNVPLANSPYAIVSQPLASDAPYPVPYPFPADPRMNPSPYVSQANLSPYPSAAPYPNKSPVLGFAVQHNVTSGDVASVPLLPPGAHLPYPPSAVSPNPYAHASAPAPVPASAPASPEAVLGSFAGTAPNQEGSDPPYNPHFNEAADNKQ